ncbi:MAG: PilZ domain-containing protein [Phycisphaerales bacterium]
MLFPGSSPHHDANRRRHGRVCLQDITCSLGAVLDLSASGLRVRTRGSIPSTGSQLAVSIEGMDQAIVLPCVVRWTRRTGLLSREVGLEFTDLNAEQKRWLSELAKTSAYNEFVRRRTPFEDDAA